MYVWHWHTDNFWEEDTVPKATMTLLIAMKIFVHCLPLMCAHFCIRWFVKSNIFWTTLCKQNTQVSIWLCVCVWICTSTSQHQKEMESGIEKKNNHVNCSVLLHSNHILIANWMQLKITLCLWKSSSSHVCLGVCICIWPVYCKCNHMWTQLQFAKQSFRLSCV